MRFYLGSDHAAIDLRKKIAAHAREEGHEIIEEIGPSSPDDKADYPDIAMQVCRKIAADTEGAFGLLMCGTGQGMAMSANRVRGIRAAVCAEPFSARMGRAHNDANVLCMGGRVVGLGLAAEIFDAFCETDFEGGRHERRVAKVNAM
jgi:ribose 5-phosphate isomerase B